MIRVVPPDGETLPYRFTPGNWEFSNVDDVTFNCRSTLIDAIKKAQGWYRGCYHTDYGVLIVRKTT